MRTSDVNVGLFLISALLCAGCSTVSQLEPQLVSERLPFIQDGKTSKAEILSRLGEPANHYETGRILTYKMCKNIELQHRLHVCGTRPTAKEDEGLRKSPQLFSSDTLILVFGLDNLVERHSLVIEQ